jgi:hypothetical protein
MPHLTLTLKRKSTITTEKIKANYHDFPKVMDFSDCVIFISTNHNIIFLQLKNKKPQKFIRRIRSFSPCTLTNVASNKILLLSMMNIKSFQNRNGYCILKHVIYFIRWRILRTEKRVYKIDFDCI